MIIVKCGQVIKLHVGSAVADVVYWQSKCPFFSFILFYLFGVMVGFLLHLVLPNCDIFFSVMGNTVLDGCKKCNSVVGSQSR